MNKNQPTQPLYTDAHGVQRFRANAIVQFLLDKGGMDMNTIAARPFSREDRVQFAQLIGYSFSGFGELGYVNDEDYVVPQLVLDGQEDKDARISALEAKLCKVRLGMRDGLAALYDKHPDDFCERPTPESRDA